MIMIFIIPLAIILFLVDGVIGILKLVISPFVVLSLFMGDVIRGIHNAEDE